MEKKCNTCTATCTGAGKDGNANQCTFHTEQCSSIQSPWIDANKRLLRIPTWMHPDDCSDLISRETLIDFLLNVPFLMEHELLKDLAIDWVNQQPRVEAVPIVHGEWINTDGYDEWECSECGQEENCDDYPTECGINFCSRCGADMRKKVQDGKIEKNC